MGVHYVGDEAITQYVDSGMDGRLIQSIKSRQIENRTFSQPAAFTSAATISTPRLCGINSFTISDMAPNMKRGISGCRCLSIFSGGYVGTAGGIFRSTDNGESWRAINIGLAYIRVKSIAISPDGDMFATAAGIYLSTDLGDTWTLLKPNITGVLAFGSLS